MIDPIPTIDLVWLEILRRHVQAKSRARVARELGISATTISLVLAGKYPASTAQIEKRIIRIYGAGDTVTCRILGDINPYHCADTWERAKRIGVGGGNPDTIRLYRACLKCDLRNG